ACKEANGPFFDLIVKFCEKTGVPIVLNTSFNIMGMPIIETPLDALLCLLSTGIDYCVLGNSIVKKRDRILLGSDAMPSDSPAWPGSRTAQAEPPGMQTRRPLQDYAGEYQHATGVMKVEPDGDQLVAIYKTQRTSLVRSSHDSFEVSGEAFKGYRVSFIPDRAGFVDRVVVTSTTGVEFVFTREVERRPVRKQFMRKHAAEYELSNIRLNVLLEDDRFMVTMPGQPYYTLIAGKDDRFDLKNTPGYSVEFVMDQTGAIDGIIVRQPNGEFSLRKST